MAYNKTNWKDTIKDASGNIIEKGTPLAAQNLNKMEDGIANATEKAEKAEGDLVKVSKQLADTVEDLKDRAVNVREFGVVGDGVVDDTNALNIANDYCTANGKVMFGNGTYRTTGTIHITCDADLKNSNVLYEGSSVAVKVRKENEQSRRMFIQLPKVTQKNRVWYDDLTKIDTGIQMYNFYESQIYIPYVFDFSIGVKMSAIDTGFVYNTVIVGHLQNNRINLYGTEEGTTGWFNENVIIGGRYSHLLNSTNREIMEICHIKMEGANNNLFLKPSVEWVAPYYTLDIRGSHNTFLQARYEGGGGHTKRAIFRGYGEGPVGSNRNVLLYGYDLEHMQIVQEGNARHNVMISGDGSVEMSNRNQGTKTLQNYGSISRPALRIVGINQNPYSENDYISRTSHGYTDYKGENDTNPKIRIDHANGRIYFGSGSKSPTAYLSQYADHVRMVDGNFQTEGTWNGSHFTLGNYHLWVDTNGKLRMKNGDPTSDTDGEIVGGQS